MFGLLSLFKGVKLFKTIAVLALITVIASSIWFGYRYVTNLNNRVEILAENNTKLQLTVESYKNQLVQERQERNMIIEEITTIRDSDKESRDKISEFEKKLNDKERERRINNIRSHKESLLLRMSNTQAKCEWENFANFNGTCVNGEWVENEKK